MAQPEVFQRCAGLGPKGQPAEHQTNAQAPEQDHAALVDCCLGDTSQRSVLVPAGFRPWWDIASGKRRTSLVETLKEPTPDHQGREEKVCEH
jgi:hypothetical protein